MTVLQAPTDAMTDGVVELRLPSLRTVETLIDQGQRSCERVAVKAGFVLADTMTRTDPDAGTTLQLRYIMERAPATGPS